MKTFLFFSTPIIFFRIFFLYENKYIEQPAKIEQNDEIENDFAELKGTANGRMKDALRTKLRAKEAFVAISFDVRLRII